MSNTPVHNADSWSIRRLLAVGALAVLVSAPAMYHFFLNRIVGFKLRIP